MANIHETIAEVEKLNPELARQIKKYVKDHSYGLVYESNLPDSVRLYKKTVCVGDVVNILPPRGEFEKVENSVSWVVKGLKDGVATLQRDGETKEVPVEDVVVTVSYRDVIYPGLKEIDRIERGNADDPYHMVINAENYHALEALTYAYAGKVDCIYIDPPYNKPNARDWKYNCNYVDADDQYKHSKWLTFMERRLWLAKQLLNLNDSILIVAVDEMEYARLGLLLEKIFFSSSIQMVTTVINPSGSPRNNMFSRAEEYLYFVFFGTNSHVYPSATDMIHPLKEDLQVRWASLLRSGSNSNRASRANLFYPVFFQEDDGKFYGVGESLALSEDKSSVKSPDGCFAVWPMKKNGQEARWTLSQDTLLDKISKGYVQFGKWKKGDRDRSISYLAKGMEKALHNGELEILGKDEDGTLITGRSFKPVIPLSVWNQPPHGAGDYGSSLLLDIFAEKRFSFPKSLYAVRDALNFAVSGKKDALIIDFFAGSGTTLHAVNLLNAEDGGHRRCICVTNNEVSDSEEKKFTKAGLRPSDTDWEKYGIAHYVTWPRTKCTIEGVDIKGTPLAGNYGCEIEAYQEYDGDVTDPVTGKKVRGKLYKKVKQPAYPELARFNKADGFKANAIFCELTYESAWPIRLDNAFDAIAPILWMQAGCRGPIIRRIGKSFSTTEYYGVLFDYNHVSKFCDTIKRTPSIKTVFVVTDDQRRYSNVCRRLPGIEVHRLYETYLRTFEICGEGGLD